MDGTVVCEKAFLACPVEVRPVVDGCLLAGGAAEDFRLPGVQVRVEVDDADGAVGFVYAAQQGQCYGVVASQGYYPRQGLAGLGDAGFFGGGVGLPG